MNGPISMEALYTGHLYINTCMYIQESLWTPDYHNLGYALTVDTVFFEWFDNFYSLELGRPKRVPS